MLLLLCLAAFFCLGFPVQAQLRILGLPLRTFDTIIWFGSWSETPNAILEWYAHRHTCLSHNHCPRSSKYSQVS